MARPRPSTLDQWLLTFSSWSLKDREGALLQAQDVHKWTTAAERRLAKQTTEAEPASEQPALELGGGH